MICSPTVSVILPCYNAEKYLCQCLDSILGQSLTELEVLCVDDGSSDATPEILRRYQENDPRVIVITQRNAGAGAARNEGLRRARGKYLSFLDADDFFAPDMLEKAVARAEETEADYVVFQSDRYYQDRDAFGEMDWAVCLEELPPYQPFSYRQLTDNIFLTFVGWAWDKLYRRSFVQQHALWFQEQRTTNDMLFVFSALICAKRIAVVREVLAHQRRGNRESLSVTREKSWHCFYDALTALKQRLEQEGLFRELKQDYVNYALHFSLWHLNTLAEPTRALLEEKLRTEWFAELGIPEKPESYFWSHNEYAQYQKIMGSRRAPQGTATGCAAAPECHTLLAKLPLPQAADLAAVYDQWVCFDRIRDQLMEDPQVWEAQQGHYWKKKYQYYTQLAPELSQALSQRMSRELKRAMQLGQLRQADFDAPQWQQIQAMITGLSGSLGKLTALPLVRSLSHHIPMPVKKTAVKILRAARNAVRRK